MDKNLINEEIVKMRLLMGYDNSKTLDENLLQNNKLISEALLVEQGRSALLKRGINRLLGLADNAPYTAVKTAAKYNQVVDLFDDAIAKVGQVVDNGVIYANGDDIIKGLSNGSIRSAQSIGQISKGLLKSGKVSGDFRLTLINRAGELGSKNPVYINFVDDNVGNSVKRIKKYLEKKGYPSDIADEIARKTVERIKKIGVKPGNTSSINVKTKSDFQKWRQSMGEGWKKLTLWQKVKRIALAVAATGAGVGLLYWFFKEEAPKIFPECLTQKMTDEDVIKMSKEDLSFIIISKTGVRELDVNGGVKLFANKKCESVNGNFEGKWEESGNQISITIGGRKILIPCSSTQGGGNGGDKVSNYYECTTEPFRLYCKNDTYIGKLQECLNKNGAGLNVDGDFGPKTLEALTKVKGYEQFDGNSELKISEIDKICGIISTDTNTSTTGQQYNQTSRETNEPEAFNPTPEG